MEKKWKSFLYRKHCRFVLEFLSVLKEPILISHNSCNFGIPILIRKLKRIIGLGAIRVKIDPTSDVDKISPKCIHNMCFSVINTVS